MSIKILYKFYLSKEREGGERVKKGHTNSWQAYLEPLTVMAQSMQRNCMFAIVNGAR